MIAQDTAIKVAKKEKEESDRKKREEEKLNKIVQARAEAPRRLERLETEELDVSTLTVAELKKLLTAFGHKFPSGATKDKLVDLAKNAGF